MNRRSLAHAALALAALSLAACSQTGKGTHALGADLLAVPGQRIGNVRLGMSLADLAAAAGQPALMQEPDDTRFAYSDARLSGTYVAGAGILWIDYGRLEETPMNSAVHTPEGIHLGSGEIDVIRAYGAPPKNTPGQFDYPTRGIQFTTRNSRVARISVYPPTK